MCDERAIAIVLTCDVGAALRGPPGLGGDNLGLSNALESQSFLTGGGTGVPTVAIDTSPVHINRFYSISISLLLFEQNRPTYR